MSKSTVPAPFEAPTPMPGCPYERVRLGLGLRFHDVARLMFLTVATALLAMACGAAPEAPTEPTPAIVTPAPEPVCKSSNTAPGCPAATSAAWAITCDIATPAPAVWCAMPEGDTSGKVWCC